MENNIKKLISFRHNLHRHPELSGNEKATASAILHYLADTTPEEKYTKIGGYGIVLVFDSGNPGPVTLIRGDMDALPIDEPPLVPYHSLQAGISHKCGHDGHTAILAGLAERLTQAPLKKGKAILVFQPAEETGTGAQAMLQGNFPAHLSPDIVFAFHNIPGKEKHRIILRDGFFASASRGIVIHLSGKTAHAAEPEKGINPAFAIAEMIPALSQLPEKMKSQGYSAKITLIHLKVGEIAFGTSPGEGVLMATLRTRSDEAMTQLCTATEMLVKAIAAKHLLTLSINYTEIFPATTSHPQANSKVEKAAKSLSLPIEKNNDTFDWSEDFGHFTKRWPGCMFGIGAGTEQANLHNNTYDFPDEIIPTAIALFEKLIKNSG